jgi:hypothetical protein
MYQVVKMLLNEEADEMVNVTPCNSIKYGECFDNISYCEFLKNDCTLQLGR